MKCIATCVFALCLFAVSLGTFAEDEPSGKWWEALSPDIKDIKYKTSTDNSMQPALFYAPTGKKDEAVPLMVILHSWSSGYDNGWAKNYGEKCISAGWAFIRPHYRGPNNNPDATGSEKVVKDIVSAVEYAKKNAKIDDKMIYIAGDSGGGYTALHMVGRTPEIWAAAIVGVPPTDLVDWFNYNRKYGGGYDRALVPSCGGEPGSKKAEVEYKKRSPLTYLKNALNIPVDIKAGYFDKSVPFVHSVWAFNAIVPDKDRIPETLIQEWYKYTDEKFYSVMKKEKNLEKTVKPPETLVKDGIRKLENSTMKIFFQKISGNTVLTITDSGHSGCTSASWVWIQKQKKLIDKASPEAYCSAKVGKPQKFTVAASDGKGGALTYSWSVDGKAADANSAEFQFSPDSAGEKNVQVKVKDNEGHESLWIWIASVTK